MFETFIAIGIVISLIYSEVTELSPGGLITPGYLALFLDQPLRVLSTFLVAFFTFFVVKLLSKYLPIYGKRRFAVAVVTAIGIKMILSGFVLSVYDSSVVINSVGVIVPGLICNDMLKQSVSKTLMSIAIVTVCLFTILLVLKGSVY